MFVFTAGGYTPLGAQATSKADFEKLIVKEFCDSFEKQSATLTVANMNEELGMILLPLFTKYSEQIEKNWSIANDMEGMKAAGEKIGQLAATGCPAFQAFIKANLQEINEQRDSESVKKVSGKILRLEGKPFTYLLVQNAQGKTDKLYWMEFFPGADKLSSSAAAAYLNKPVVITFKEIEVYQALEKEYRTIKVITAVSF